MTPVEFPGANKVLRAPAGREETISDLHVYTNGSQCVSVWELSPEEIETVIRTRRIYVNVLSGGTQPPIYLGLGPLANVLF